MAALEEELADLRVEKGNLEKVQEPLRPPLSEGQENAACPLVNYLRLQPCRVSGLELNASSAWAVMLSGGGGGEMN